MENLQNDVYLPAASIDELLQFDARKPETHTTSRFLNIALRLFHSGITSKEELGQRMKLRPSTLTEMFRAEAGISFSTFVDYKRAYDIHKAIQLMRERDQWKKDQIDHLVDIDGLGDILPKKSIKRMKREINLKLKKRDEDDSARIADIVGFSNRSSLWKFVRSKRYHDIVSDLGLTPFIIRSYKD